MIGNSTALYGAPLLKTLLPGRKSMAFLALMASGAPLAAQEQDIYAFRDDAQLTRSMLTLAKRTTRGAAIPDPCRLHIVTIAGGRELFPNQVFDRMHEMLAMGVVGNDRLGQCALKTHELERDSADALVRRLQPQQENVLILEATYIPLSKTVIAYAKLRDGAGRTLGNSGRFDLPVTRGSGFETVETTASIEEEPIADKTAQAAPKLTNKLLTEVHFDPGSANITVVGERKIRQAIETIRTQNPREVRILGFTDSIGPADANKRIAGARADNVARLMREAGLNVQFVVEGRGEDGGPHKIPDGVSEPLNRCVGIIAVGVPAAQ